MIEQDKSPGDAVVSDSIHQLVARRLSRREVLVSGASAATALLGASALGGCVGLGDDDTATDPPPVATTVSFTSVAKSVDDTVSISPGHIMRNVVRTGDPLGMAVGDYVNDGSDGAFDQRAGDHHAGLQFFGLTSKGAPATDRADRGVLAINHPDVTASYLHANGPSPAPRPESEARKELDAIGASFVEVQKNLASLFGYVPASSFNRRVTASTPVQLGGPVRGSAPVRTAYSADGTAGRGLAGAHAVAATPWGTTLSGERGWAAYFARSAADDSRRSAADVRLLDRFGIVPGSAGKYAWSTVAPSDPANTDYRRWDVSVTGTSVDGSDDFRNESNTFGYLVELAPYDGSVVPVKRTALGRLAQSGAVFAPAVAGLPIVVYLGDSGEGEYLYKFVSASAWNPADASLGLAAGSKYLDSGSLYVARFDATGSGTWIALSQGANGLGAGNPLYPFATQADVCIAVRLAADSVGATRLDSPGGTSLNAQTGEIYLALNHNAQRGTAAQPVDPANPRSYTDIRAGTTLSGNVNGHVIRWREAAGPSGATFQWDVYVFGAQADADPNAVNLSALTADNDLSGPSGIAFAPNGLLWLQTDDRAYTDVSNAMLLGALTGAVGDGGARPVANADGTVAGTYLGAAPGNRLKRMLVGPVQAAIAGVAWTPDGRSMFVSIQHPGVDGTAAAISSHYPDGATSRPRSTTISFRRGDGQPIG